MGLIMNSPKGAEPGVPDRVSISGPHVASATTLTKYVMVGEQTPTTHATQKCHSHEQDLYGNHKVSHK